MALKQGSLYRKLEDRVLDNTMQISNLAARTTSLEVATTDLASRMVAIENGQGLESRVVFLESWRGNKESAISNANTNLNESNDLLMGLTTLVETVNTTNARVNEHGNKINAILAAMRTREIIAA